MRATKGYCLHGYGLGLAPRTNTHFADAGVGGGGTRETPLMRNSETVLTLFLVRRALRHTLGVTRNKRLTGASIASLYQRSAAARDSPPSAEARCCDGMRSW